MDNYIKDIKPFYIYSDKGYLYIKNINEQSEKIANNISKYCANIDNFNNIHICCIDNLGRLIYLANNNGKWKKKTIHRVFNNIKNIKDIRLYVLNNDINVFTVENYSLNESIYRVSHFNKKTIHRVFNNIKNIKDIRLYVLNNDINVFTVENYSLNESIYRVSHFNFNTKNNRFSRYNINNIYKDNKYIYKLNIDDNSNIVFEYKSLNKSNRGFTNHKITFNNLERKWISTKSILRNDHDEVKIISTIKDDLFEYCYNIKYKL